MNEVPSWRQAGIQDAAAVLQLSRAAYAKWVPLIGREPWPMTADYAKAVKENSIDLLYLGNQLAALVETIPRPDHLLIESVAVLPAHQGKGLGRKLMDRVEMVARSLNLEELKLYTNKIFVENIAFYRRLGYAVEREEVWVGGTIVHMRKSIPP